MDKEHIPEVWLADGGVFMALSLLMIWLVFIPMFIGYILGSRDKRDS